MSNTVNLLSKQLDVKPESLQRKLKRYGFGSVSKDGLLTEEMTRLLVNGSKPISGKFQEKTLTPKEVKSEFREAIPKPVFKPKGIQWRKILQTASLPMLGLAASYGVYYFALLFVPFGFALIEATAFELTYIGLASMQGLGDRQRQYARRVAIGAVLVSVVYNTLSAGLHLNPQILNDVSPVVFWALSVIHGAPLAVLGYFVADLIFHQKK